MSADHHFIKHLLVAAVCLCGYIGSLALNPAQLDSDTRIERVRQIYHVQLNVREHSGRNDGRMVETYLAYTGLGKGHPWCAAFVSWVYGQAGIPGPRTAWSPALFPPGRVIWRQDAKNTVVPRTADVFGIWYTEKKRVAHAGFIDHWDGKWLITVEGNTNLAGAREGDGVYRKRRPVRSVYAVARYIYP